MKPIAEFVNNKLWVAINGKTFVFEPSTTQKKRGSSATTESMDVAAPMPGKITSIKVSVGDVVKSEQPVIVMEAMKMEYTLKSLANGKVDSINCSVGDQVNLGDILICLK